jgi:hypothetical protein
MAKSGKRAIRASRCCPGTDMNVRKPRTTFHGKVRIFERVLRLQAMLHNAGKALYTFQLLILHLQETVPNI